MLERSIDQLGNRDALFDVLLYAARLYFALQGLRPDGRRLLGVERCTLIEDNNPFRFNSDLRLVLSTAFSYGWHGGVTSELYDALLSHRMVKNSENSVKTVKKTTGALCAKALIENDK